MTLKVVRSYINEELHDEAVKLLRDSLKAGADRETQMAFLPQLAKIYAAGNEIPKAIETVNRLIDMMGNVMKRGG